MPNSLKSPRPPRWSLGRIRRLLRAEGVSPPEGDLRDLPGPVEPGAHVALAGLLDVQADRLVLELHGRPPGRHMLPFPPAFHEAPRSGPSECSKGRVTMDDTQILLGPTPQNLPPAGAEGGYVDLAGQRFFRISNVDTMAPFLMSLASDSDHWLFISSTGALTAGRGNPDRALFPYTTDDRIHDARDRVGGKTVLLVAGRPGALAVGAVLGALPGALPGHAEPLQERAGQRPRLRGDQPRPGADLPPVLADQRTVRLRAHARRSPASGAVPPGSRSWTASRTCCLPASAAGTRWSSAPSPTATRTTSSTPRPAWVSSG